MSDDWTSGLPADGVWRVHPEPELLPRAPRFEEGEVAQSRFDDPAGQYKVRYAGQTLRGALLEVLSASFRVRQSVEDRIAAITNAEPEPGDLADLDEVKEVEGPGQVPERWLAAQSAARFIASEPGRFVNVLDARFLAEYSSRPRIRRAIDRHLGQLYDLDAGTILLNLEHGRPVTQAVSAELWSEDDSWSGLRYLSRLDLDEECWAVFDRTRVEFEAAQPLSPSYPRHREALQSAASLLHLQLPPSWEG